MKRRIQNIPLLVALTRHYKSGSLSSAYISGNFAYIEYRIIPKCGYKSVAKFIFNLVPSVEFVDFGGLCFARNLMK